MTSLAERWGVSSFELNDDLLNGDAEWLAAFVRALRGSGLSWAGFVEPRPHPHGFWQELTQSGCRALTLGVQSLSAPLLRKMHRSPDTHTIREAVAACLRSRYCGGRWTSWSAIPAKPRTISAPP